MLQYSQGTENLIKKFGSDTKLLFKESHTGINFTATLYEVLEANCELNYLLNVNGMVTIQDLLTSLHVDISPVANCLAQELACGWNYLCFEGWDGVWVEFFITDIEENDDTVFVIEYYATPCFGCSKCEGIECDRYQGMDFTKPFM